MRRPHSSPLPLHIFSVWRGISARMRLLIASPRIGHIKANRSTQQTQHTYTVVFAPRRTELCMRALEEEGVLHEVSVVDYGLEFVPLEKDVLSMEDDRAWPAIFGVSSQPFWSWCHIRGADRLYAPRTEITLASTILLKR